jgi:hypothetical protein
VLTLIAKLSDEDLRRWRMVSARRNALESNPRAYSATESEQIWMAYYTLAGEFIERHGVEDHRDWKISAAAGEIFYEE